MIAMVVAFAVAGIAVLLVVYALPGQIAQRKADLQWKRFSEELQRLGRTAVAASKQLNDAAEAIRRLLEAWKA